MPDPGGDAVTRLGYAMALWPAVHLVLVLAALASFVAAPGVLTALVIPLVVYVLPLALCRLHDEVHPLREGRSLLVGGGYAPWWGASRLQWLFVSFPATEEALRLVPGLFSAWLRAWGSDIGAGVIWTPGFVVLDRGLLEVGDHVVFGYQSGVSGHVVSAVGDNLRIVVARVRVGDGTVVGAGSKLAPGVTLGRRVVLGYDSRPGLFTTVGDGATTGPLCWSEAHVQVPAGARIGPFARLYRDGGSGGRVDGARTPPPRDTADDGGPESPG